MMQAISLARKSIRIMTPYFLPDDRFLSLLCMAAIRGVEIDIITPEQSNQFLVDWARNINNKLPLRYGCKIWLAKPPFNHSKLMVIDNMEVYHEKFSEKIDDFIILHKNKPLKLKELEKRFFLVKLRDATTRLLLPYL